jgi:hypothetical protein
MLKKKNNNKIIELNIFVRYKLSIDTKIYYDSAQGKSTIALRVDSV